MGVERVPLVEGLRLDDDRSAGVEILILIDEGGRDARLLRPDLSPVAVVLVEKRAVNVEVLVGIEDDALSALTPTPLESPHPHFFASGRVLHRCHTLVTQLGGVAGHIHVS